MKKQSLVKGSLILGAAGILTKFMGLFFRWPLIMLIGDEGVGYYQMSYPLYMFYLALAAGVPVAISKMISEKNAVNDIDGIFEVVKEALIFMVLIGTGTTVFLFFCARPILEILKWDYKAYYSIIGISFAPIVISFMTVLRGFFQGLQNMNHVAVSQIIEQLGRVIFGVGLAIFLLPRGIEFSAGGAAFGATVGAVFGTAYLFSNYKKIKKQLGIKKIKTCPKVLNSIIHIAIPISLGTTVGSVMNLIDSIIVPQKLLQAGCSNTEATILYAQLTGKASVIVNIPMTLSMAFCITLIPIIAENFVLNRYKEVNKKIDMAIKMSSVIALPCTLGIFILALPIMKLIFPGNFEGFEILKYLSISIPFIILTQTTTSILQGTGYYLKPVFNLLIGCVIKILITSVLVSLKEVNIYGAVLGSILAYAIASILNIVTVRIKLKVNIHLYETVIKPFLAAIIMGLAVVLSYTFMYLKTDNNNISCIVSICIGIIIYGILIVMLKVFNLEEFIDKIKFRQYKRR